MIENIVAIITGLTFIGLFIWVYKNSNRKEDKIGSIVVIVVFLVLLILCVVNLVEIMGVVG